MTKREKANARFAAGMLLKQQSFTVMVRDYDYVRSALSFPLGQAGRLSVDAIAPSVYAVKKPRKGSTPDEQPTGETADGPDSAPPARRARRGCGRRDLPRARRDDQAFASLVNRPSHLATHLSLHLLAEPPAMPAPLLVLGAGCACSARRPCGARSLSS